MYIRITHLEDTYTPFLNNYVHTRGKQTTKNMQHDTIVI